MPCKCLQRIRHGDWAICHISCIIPIRTGTVASWKGQDRAVCIMSVEILEARVCELEKLMVHTHDPLSLPVEEIVQNGTTVLYGPDTHMWFDSLLLVAVTNELCNSAPDLFSLLNCLADFQHNAATSSEVTGKHCKVVISSCTLVNAQLQWAMDRVTVLSASCLWHRQLANR